MPLEKPGWCKLSQLVPDHIFCHEDRNELRPGMNRARMSNHIRNDRGATRPGLNDLAIFILIHPLHFLKQVVVNECALTD
jgi:hypothetical protein